MDAAEQMARDQWHICMANYKEGCDRFAKTRKQLNRLLRLALPDPTKKGKRR